MSDQVVTPLAEALLACYAAELAKQDDEVRPTFVCLRPGERVEPLLSTNDDECCHGLAWVRVAGFHPSATFPHQDTEVVKCGPLLWAVVLEMGAVRCAPVGTANALPSCEEWTAVKRAVLDDAAAMRCALRCFSPGPDSRRPRRIVPGQWQPYGVDANCVGGTMTVTVAAPGLDCCDDDGSS